MGYGRVAFDVLDVEGQGGCRLLVGAEMQAMTSFGGRWDTNAGRSMAVDVESGVRRLDERFTFWSSWDHFDERFLDGRRRHIL